jgi:cytochrome b561
MGVIIVLVVSLGFGMLVRLQWFNFGGDEPPPKPLPQWAAVLIGITLTVIFLIIVIPAINSFGREREERLLRERGLVQIENRCIGGGDWLDHHNC